ncbi:hypothetical protein GCM10027162_71920 [Streptomyces incanus]
MAKCRLRGSASETVETAGDKTTEACMKHLGLACRAGGARTKEWGVEENRHHGIQDPHRALTHGYRPISVVHPRKTQRASIRTHE